MLTENEYEELKHTIAKKGFDCSFYRDPYLKRRLNLRMARKKTKTYSEYRKLINLNPDEFQKLIDCLAVNVTSFFRDVTPYKILQEKIFPEIAAEKKSTRSACIRVWSAACSTGQEPYSIAMTANASIHSQLQSGLNLKIIASDIDSEALGKAKAGMYKENELENIDEKRKRRYFKFIDGICTVKDSLKSYIQFKHIDLIKDNPPLGTDIVFCRNMLIYIDMRMQTTIIAKFYQSLQYGGYLFLGKTEILPDNLRSKFETINSGERIFKKK